MIETDQQRRWWFAAHPEFSSSRRGEKSKHYGDEDKESGGPSREFVDKQMDELLKHEKDDFFTYLLQDVKFWFGTESVSATPAENHALLWGEEETARANDAVVKGWFDVPTVPNPFDKVRHMLDYFGRNHPAFMSDPNRPSERVTRALREAAEIARLAEQISKGHAYDKHVVEQDEFPEVVDRKQFQNLIQKILSNPTEWKALEGGRSAYWDKETGTVVIRDPRHPDGGTAFRPRTGRRYYDDDLTR